MEVEWGAKQGESAADDRSVLKSEVHKHDLEHVLLTAVRTTDEGVLDGRFRLPDTHDQPRFADFMEVQRQAGIVHAHRRLAVPPSDVFVLNSIELFIADIARASSQDTFGNVTVCADETSPRAARARTAAHRFTVATDSGASGVGASNASFVPRSVYERLRTTPRPSVRAPRSGLKGMVSTVTLVSPARDPLTSDHPSDHVSAMAVVLGMEKALDALFPDTRLVGLSLRFFSYVEFSGAPPTLHIARERRNVFDAVISQDDFIHVAAEGILARRDGS